MQSKSGQNQSSQIQNSQGQSARGFTLIEVLVAVAISALLSVMAYSAFTSAVNAAERIEITSERLHQVDQALQLMERDFSQLIPRGINSQTGGEPPVLGEGASDIEPYVRFTRQGWLNPLSRLRSNVQRVEYRFIDNTLVRRHMTRIEDITNDELPEVELFDGITEMELEFLDRNVGGRPSSLGGSWQESWNQAALPEAVQLTLQLEDMGEIRRLFILPQQ